MSSLPTLFRAILTSLWAVIAPIAAKNPAKTALLIRIANHLNRTIQRFETLFARWQTNTLPKLRPNKPHPNKPHPEKPHPGRPHTSRTTPRLPRGPAWILRHVDHYNARGCASQLQHLLHAEDMAAFLAAVPRAARLLRPLAKSLGLHMPGDPPPPLPKPARPPKPAHLNAPSLNQPQTTALSPAPARIALPFGFSKAR